MLRIKIKDQNLREKHKILDLKRFVLKTIFKNDSFVRLVRWNAFLKLKTVSRFSNRVGAVNLCVESVTKKRLNNLTKLSRHIFLKHLKSGAITNILKSCW